MNIGTLSHSSDQFLRSGTLPLCNKIINLSNYGSIYNIFFIKGISMHKPLKSTYQETQTTGTLFIGNIKIKNYYTMSCTLEIFHTQNN